MPKQSVQPLRCAQEDTRPMFGVAFPTISKKSSARVLVPRDAKSKRKIITVGYRQVKHYTKKSRFNMENFRFYFVSMVWNFIVKIKKKAFVRYLIKRRKLHSYI
jgi:hypothetical protein